MKGQGCFGEGSALRWEIGEGRLCPSGLTSLKVRLKETLWGYLFLDFLQKQEFSFPHKHLSVTNSQYLGNAEGTSATS